MFLKAMLWATLFVPWLSLFFLKKDDIKRYMPVSVFSALMVTVVSEIGYSLKWWETKILIVPWGYITNIAFTYGIFMIGTLWIFYFTARNFWVYLVVNLVIDALFIFALNDWFEGMGMHTLYLGKWTVVGIMTVQSLILFAYHRWQERIFVPKRHDNNGLFEREIVLNGARKKAKT